MAGVPHQYFAVWLDPVRPKVSANECASASTCAAMVCCFAATKARGTGLLPQLGAVLVIGLLAVPKFAQPAPDSRLGFGRAAQPDEIQRENIDVRPDGQGLPAGSGTPEMRRLPWRQW